MAVSAKHSGWRKSGTSLMLYVEGTLVATFTSTGVTFAVAANFDGAVDFDAGIDVSGGTTVLPQALTIGGIAYTFPADNGDAGEQLQTDGAGVLTWETSGV